MNTHSSGNKPSSPRIKCRLNAVALPGSRPGVRAWSWTGSGRPGARRFRGVGAGVRRWSASTPGATAWATASCAEESHTYNFNINLKTFLINMASLKKKHNYDIGEWMKKRLIPLRHITFHTSVFFNGFNNTSAGFKCWTYLKILKMFLLT